jgi:hypothetical protein
VCAIEVPKVTGGHGSAVGAPKKPIDDYQFCSGKGIEVQALYQGTTLVVPQKPQKDSGFSPC